MTKEDATDLALKTLLRASLKNVYTRLSTTKCQNYYRQYVLG